MSAVKGQGIFSLHLAIVTQEYLGEWIPYVKSEEDPLLTGIPCFESRNNTNCWWHVSISASFLVSFFFSFFFVKLNELLMFSTEKQHSNLSWDKETIRLDGNSFQE